MLIKKVDGTHTLIETDYNLTDGSIWVNWSDIKPILEEYQQAIKNEGIGISDWSIINKDE